MVNQRCKVLGTMGILWAKWLPFKDLLLPIVSIGKEEWTKKKVEKLASTLTTSVTAVTLPVMQRPRQP